MDRSTPLPTAAHTPGARVLLHLLVIAAACIVPYLNSIATSPHFDDLPVVFHDQKRVIAIAEAPDAEAVLRMLATTPRSVGYLTFSINYALGGTDERGYHIVNIAIHLLNAVLVYLLVLAAWEHAAGAAPENQTPDRGIRTIALGAAVLFSIHPVQTQAVTYIVQRFTSLAAFFYLVSALCFLKARSAPGSRSSFLFLCLSFTAALLSTRTKEIGFTLPFVLMAAEFFLVRTRRRPLLLVPFALLVLINIIAVLGIDRPLEGTAADLDERLRAQTTLPRANYLLTQTRVIVTYLRLLVLPVNQNFDYDYPVFPAIPWGAVLLSVLLLAALAGVAFYAGIRLRRPGPAREDAGWRLLGFGISWFFISLSVESSVIPILDVINEHRLYLPSVGAVIALAGSAFVLPSVAPQLRAYRKQFAVGFAAVAALLAITTAARNRVWENEYTFWSDVTVKSPGKARGFYNLGLTCHDDRKLREAVALYTRAITNNPRHFKALMNRGNALDDLGNPDAAIVNYLEALQLDPEDPDIFYNLGVTYLRKQDLSRARHYLFAACERGHRGACGQLSRLGSSR